MNLTPTIHLPGKCQEAIAFYQDVLNAELLSLRRVSDFVAPELILPGTAEMIARAVLRVGDSVIYLTEGHSCGDVPFHGVSLSLTCSSRVEAEGVFHALAEGGRIRLPMQDRALVQAFGSVYDQFGVHWTVEMSEAAGVA